MAGKRELGLSTSRPSSGPRDKLCALSSSIFSFQTGIMVFVVRTHIKHQPEPPGRLVSINYYSYLLFRSTVQPTISPLAVLSQSPNVASRMTHTSSANRGMGMQKGGGSTYHPQGRQRGQTPAQLSTPVSTSCLITLLPRHPRNCFSHLQSGNICTVPHFLLCAPLAWCFRIPGVGFPMDARATSGSLYLSRYCPSHTGL